MELREFYWKFDNHFGWMVWPEDRNFKNLPVYEKVEIKKEKNGTKGFIYYKDKLMGFVPKYNPSLR